MMLPSFPTYSRETDVNKQMAQMRNYLNMLKDEMENALNNIGYDQLDADLRKRIDELGDSVYANNNEILEIAGTLKAKYITADEIASSYATFGWVSSNYATFNWVSSNYATITYLEGNFATFDFLDTYYLTAERAILTYATITSLEGVDAKFHNLNADYITAGVLNVQRIDLNGLSSSGLAGYTVKVGGLYTEGNITANTGGINSIDCGSLRFKGANCKWGSINGVQCIVKDI